MYPEELIAPMRAELTNVGFQEFRTSDEVGNHLKDHKGTTFIVINSSLRLCSRCCKTRCKICIDQSASKPDVLATVICR